MRLKVNIDAGLAIDLDKVAALIRAKNTSETLVVLVSGHQFTLDRPLSEAIEIVNGMRDENDEEEKRKFDADKSDSNDRNQE